MGSPVPRTNLQAYPPSPRSDEDDIAKRTSSEGSLIAEVGRDKEETVETEAAQVDTPSLFSKLPTEIRYQICKEASATRSTVSASHCTVDTSGIEAMTNLMLVSKQMHQDVINSALCDNRFFIAVNDFHLMFFSKQLHRHKLCRFTPPAFCKLVKHWQIHIHFGEDPSLTWPGPGRVLRSFWEPKIGATVPVFRGHALDNRFIVPRRKTGIAYAKKHTFG
ncbi:MAG: hypothetical protein LQ352_005913 [Teloschistes flavicans]|nr:MAG: hypothetical protein LQ352_005913 [Teloschistes flavicans]